jgi:hypothetical protein
MEPVALGPTGPRFAIALDLTPISVVCNSLFWILESVDVARKHECRTVQNQVLVAIAVALPSPVVLIAAACLCSHTRRGFENAREQGPSIADGPPTRLLASGEVDVVAETVLARPFEQPQQRRSLLSARFASDDHDDSSMRLTLGELQEIVTIASHQHAVVLVRKLNDGLIGSFRRKDLAQTNDFMVEFSEQVREILGNVLVEEELHR